MLKGRGGFYYGRRSKWQRFLAGLPTENGQATLWVVFALQTINSRDTLINQTKHKMILYMPYYYRYNFNLKIANMLLIFSQWSLNRSSNFIHKHSAIKSIARPYKRYMKSSLILLGRLWLNFVLK